MAEVFISYHEKSAEGLAAQIADTLEASGISCWYAKRDIPTGGDFARAIPLQIDACKVFLLILNEDAQTSEHIGNELALAFSRWNRKKDITIFPVKIGDFEEESWIKYYLVRAQILKCAVLDAERMQELARRVAELLNRELKPSTKVIEWGESEKDAKYMQRGEDIDVSLTLTSEEAALGCQKLVTFERYDTCFACHGNGCADGMALAICPNCHGAGQVQVRRRTPFGMMNTFERCARCIGKGQVTPKLCKECHGSGMVRRRHTIEVDFPSGIEEGQTFRAHGAGHAGKNGGVPGDLYMSISIRPNRNA